MHVACLQLFLAEGSLAPSPPKRSRVACSISKNDCRERFGGEGWGEGARTQVAPHARRPHSKRLEPSRRGFSLTCRSLPPHPNPLPHNVAELVFASGQLFAATLRGRGGFRPPDLCITTRALPQATVKQAFGQTTLVAAEALRLQRLTTRNAR